MSWRGARLGRVFGASAAAGLGLYSLVTLAAAPATVLAGGCSKANPQADVMVTQSAVGTYANGAAQAVTFTVKAENEGPCSASGITVSATAADANISPLAITIVSTNPSNANATCTPLVGTTTSGQVSCTFPKLSAPSDANTANPGTGVMTFSVTNPTQPPQGSGNLGGTGAAPVTSLAQALAASPGDPDLGNNTSHGAFLVDGGTLNVAGFQTTTLLVPGGYHGAAEIEPGVKDPNPPKGSFGQIVLINSDAFLDNKTGQPATPLQTVTFDVPITSSTPQSASKVQVWHELDGTTTWQPVPDCTNSSTQPDPSPSCVESVSKLKGGPTGSYFEVVVFTTVTSKWVT